MVCWILWDGVILFSSNVNMGISLKAKTWDLNFFAGWIVFFSLGGVDMKLLGANLESPGLVGSVLRDILMYVHPVIDGYD
jgi:hypothetical protein